MSPRTVASLGVADVERSVEFYRRHFGFELADAHRDGRRIVWCCLRSGSGDLMLQRLEGEAVERLRERAGTQTFVLYVRPADIRTVRESLRGAGAGPSDLERTSYGTEEFFVRDPDGYELWVSAPVGTTIPRS